MQPEVTIPLIPFVIGLVGTHFLAAALALTIRDWTDRESRP